MKALRFRPEFPLMICGFSICLLLQTGCSGGLSSSFTPTEMDLPILRLTTAGEAPIASEETYVGGHVSLDPNDGKSTPFESDLTVKGHGNTSWLLDKKPYKIKLSDKASLLGMPADKEWVLLANHDDKTLVRNATAFELSRRMGMVWTPRSQFVELFLNGEYEGNYQLTEEVKIADDRVNIHSLDPGDTSSSVVSGGYLMEVDHNDITGGTFNLSSGAVPITLHDPDPPAPEQLAYINTWMQGVEDNLYSPGFADPKSGYRSVIDVNSFIDWYLVNEIFKNNDAIYWSSVYLYKDRNAKVFMGPVWDFDLGAGNANLNDTANPTGWWVRNPWVVNGQWIARLFEDPAFRILVQARWNELKKSQLDTLPAYIDQTTMQLSLSEKNNFQRWPILNTYILANPEVAGSYPGEVKYMRDWLITRIAWMDSQINAPNY